MTSSDDLNRNLTKAFRNIRFAAESGARILCFPQLFALPWFLENENKGCLSLAIKNDDEILQRFAEAAREYKVVLVCPFFEKKEDRTFCSAAVFENDGSLVGIYRKVHIPDIPGWRERFYFHPGETGFPVFNTSCGRIGVQLCWDNFFPEGSRALALNGAELIFAPTASAYASQERWHHVLSANAFVNNLFVFRVNRVGHDHGLDFYGHSFCVNPYGELVSDPIGMQEGILLTDVDLSLVAEAREETGFLKERRGIHYEAFFSSRKSE